MSLRDRITLIIGGVGGAKLALGLYRVLSPNTLTVIVNTGDDFTHLGLRICPDLDTITYALSGLSDYERGWGISGDTFSAMSMIKTLGGPDWFSLGDVDLGISLFRTDLLEKGERLSEIEKKIADRLGIHCSILPMTDDRLSTYLDTDVGELAFQNYFVEHRWQPKVRRILFQGESGAVPGPGVIEAIESSTLVIIGPSNPFLSIAPVLAIKDIRRSLEKRRCPCVCLSPIISGQAIKGPTAKLMRELDLDVSPLTVADYYADLIDGIMIDNKDINLDHNIAQRGFRVGTGNIFMGNESEKIDCAENLLAWAEGTFT